MDSSAKKIPSLIGAIFLVSGTTVGGGMLAMPAAAASIGFFPSTWMLIVAWAFMTTTALILAEVCMWMPQDTHIISMANHLLGKPAKIIAWIVYLFMGYFSLIAYISGGSDIFTAFFSNISFSIPQWMTALLFVVVFGFVIEIGSSWVSRLNTILFWGLIISYFTIVSIGILGIEFKNLQFTAWKNAYGIIPLLLTSFSFQMMVPNLATYMQRDIKRIRTAIIGGTTLSLAIYLLWNFVVLGSISQGQDSSLALAYAEGKLPLDTFGQIGGQWFSIGMHLFSFCALVTSFLGIGWGLYDFLADGLQWQKAGTKRLWLWMLVMLPSLTVALIYPRGFIGALEATGGYGDVILNGMIPILMIWMGIYVQKRSSESRLYKTKPFLIGLFAFCTSVAIIQFGQDIGAW